MEESILNLGEVRLQEDAQDLEHPQHPEPAQALKRQARRQRMRDVAGQSEDHPLHEDASEDYDQVQQVPGDEMAWAAQELGAEKDRAPSSMM